MEQKGNKHKNYEILNLLGYGLSKFDNIYANLKQKNSAFRKLFIAIK